MQMTDIGLHSKLVSESKRVEWCDIYKGIVILLVVIGHFTNQYQGYIYQFHMAAFFFISGYTTNFTKYSTMEIIVRKFYTLMFPYYFFSILGTFLFYLLSKLEVLSYVSTTRFPDSTLEALRVIFMNGSAYCDWLGALWFVPVLFGACILVKIIFNVFNNRIYIVISSVVVFLIGQYMSYRGGNSTPIDLICLAQYYVILGTVIKECGLIKRINTQLKNNIGYSAIVIVAGICFLTIGKGYTVDWPSRRFNGVVDLINPLFGVVVSIAVAILLSKVKYVKSIFITMGTYSFAIMVFHFLGFKISYLLLILSGKEAANILALLTPTDSVRTNIWWGFAVSVSIAISIILWNVLMKFKLFRIYSGRNMNLVHAFMESTFTVLLHNLYKCVSDLLLELIRVSVKQIPKLKNHIVLFVIMMMTAVLVNIYSYGGVVTVRFPYIGEQVYFEEGWFEQAENEEYRWVEMVSRARVILLGQDKLYIHGYIPDNVKNISKMQIFLNDVEIYSDNVNRSCTIEIDLDVAEYKKFGFNQLDIIFDGCRVPEEGDDDIRNFSALIDNIIIY